LFRRYIDPAIDCGCSFDTYSCPKSDFDNLLSSWKQALIRELIQRYREHTIDSSRYFDTTSYQKDDFDHSLSSWGQAPIRERYIEPIIEAAAILIHVEIQYL